MKIIRKFLFLHFLMTTLIDILIFYMYISNINSFPLKVVRNKINQSATNKIFKVSKHYSYFEIKNVI